MKNLKKIIVGILVIGIIVITGCEATKFGKKSQAISKANSKVQNVESLISYNLKDKLEQAANLNYGVGYALSKEENPSKAVEVAIDLNSRAASLTGIPTIEEMNNMKKMIDDLTSQLQTERAHGAQALAEKDNKIQTIQNESKVLMIAKDKEIQKYMKMAQEIALKADAIQSKLDDMDSFFGLGAIWYGIKKLVVSLAWFLGIGFVLYVILRFAAMSNPIAGSIFSIFSLIGSWFVHIIQILVPKAVETAGYIGMGITNEYKSVMTKIIDCIETVKRQQKVISTVVTPSSPTSPINVLDSLNNELAKSLNSNEKLLVSKIKQDIGYS